MKPVNKYCTDGHFHTAEGASVPKELVAYEDYEALYERCDRLRSLLVCVLDASQMGSLDRDFYKVVELGLKP